MGGLVILAVFLGCVFASVPIGFSIGLSVVAYALATGSVNMGYIASGLFASCDSFPLMAIPSIVGLMLGSVVGVRLLAVAKPKFIRYMVICVLLFSGGKALLKGLGIG